MHHDTTRVRLFSHRIPGHIVLAVCGELDIATTPDLREQLAIVLEDTALPVIIDLSGISFCDASGLALLVGTQRRARLRGLTVALTGPRRNVSKLLRISGLDRAFAIYPTLAAARRDRGGPGCRRTTPGDKPDSRRPAEGEEIQGRGQGARKRRHTAYHTQRGEAVG